MRGLKVGDKIRVLECPPRPEYQFKVGEVLTITKIYEGQQYEPNYFYGFKDRRAINGKFITSFVAENKLGGELVD